MRTSMTLPLQDWITNPSTVRIMNLLGAQESDPQALFVGGCVRNALLAQPVSDIDIATRHRPDVVMSKLLGAGVRAIPTGLEHGTVTAMTDDGKYEITTLRRDVETDGRHAVIAFTDKWEEDAQRRDFTINTLLCDLDGRIYDPAGAGLADLMARRVVFVGEPAQRIAEDYLRILRFFRFHGKYGQGAPDDAAMQACAAMADALSKLSRERVTQEFLKIIALPKVGDVLENMAVANIMPCLRVATYRADYMERLCQLQIRYEAVDILARLFLFCGDDVERFEKWLLLTNSQKRRIQGMSRVYDDMTAPSRKKIRELVYHHGNEAVLQTYFVRLAIEEKCPELEAIDIARYWQAPVFPITGDDLIGAGIAPGKNLGKHLKSLEEKWIKSDFKTLPKI